MLGLAIVESESRGEEGPEGEGTREQDLAGLEALEPRRVCPLLSLPALRLLPRPPITSKALTQIRQATSPMQAEQAPLDRGPGTPGSLSCKGLLLILIHFIVSVPIFT